MSDCFEVVALALEPRERLDRFADHYLRHGATRVSLYYDEDVDFVFTDPRIAFHKCDAEFWRRLGYERPFSVEARQRAIYNYAYASSKAHWCLIVDLDEYIFGPVSLQNFFGGLAEDLDSVRFVPAEMVFGPEDQIDKPFGATSYRLPVGKYLAPALSRLLYGKLAPLFSRGLLGHSRGKQALRTGKKQLKIDIHDAQLGGKRIGSFAESRTAGLLLGHYDAIDLAHWTMKCEGRLRRGDAKEMGAKREMQLHLFGKCSGERARRALFKQIYGLEGWKLRLLSRIGLVGTITDDLLDQSVGNFESERCYANSA